MKAGFCLEPLTFHLTKPYFAAGRKAASLNADFSPGIAGADVGLFFLKTVCVQGLPPVSPYAGVVWQGARIACLKDVVQRAFSPWIRPFGHDTLEDEGCEPECDRPAGKSGG